MPTFTDHESKFERRPRWKPDASPTCSNTKISSQVRSEFRFIRAADASLLTAKIEKLGKLDEEIQIVLLV